MIINLTQNTPEWLEYRRDKFNASEAGDVMGVGFNKPYRLAQIKYQDKQVFQSGAMKRGQEYEPKIRAILNEKLNLDLSPVVMQSDADPRFSASLDGYDIVADTFCEIKFSDSELEYLRKNGKPSEKYFWQIQHQYYVSEAKKCIFAVGYIDEDFEVQCEHVEVERDEKATKKLIKAWNEFEKTYKDAAPDEEWLNLSENIAKLTERKKQIEDELQALKDRAIEKAAGVEMKAYGLTIYKTERKESYDYKAFCEHTGAVIPSEYLKAGSVSWSVRTA